MLKILANSKDQNDSFDYESNVYWVHYAQPYKIKNQESEEPGAIFIGGDKDNILKIKRYFLSLVKSDPILKYYAKE